MKNEISFVCQMLDQVSSLPKTGELHHNYHDMARLIAEQYEIPQLFLLVRRNLSGWQVDEIGFWVYAAGIVVDRYGNHRPNPIVEISLKDSSFLQEINERGEVSKTLETDLVLREKLYLASAPASDLDEYLAGSRISDRNGGPGGFLLVPQFQRSLLAGDLAELVSRVLRLALAKSSDAYSESEQLRTSLSMVAGELQKIAERPRLQEDSATSEHHDHRSSEDVLQSFLDFSRKQLRAEKCALFLVDYQKRSLALERISEEGGTLHYEQIPHIPTYDLEHYDPSKKGQGITPWVLHRKKPFNARSYEELVYSSEGHHKGNWDPFIYGGERNAKDLFQCNYMTPLLAGDTAIGVLKYENRTEGAPLPYFDQADEREIDLMSEVVANMVLSQRVERNRYDWAMSAIARILVTHFGRPEFYEKILEECQRWLHADLCSLFLVSNHKDLALKAIVGLPKEKLQLLKGFVYEDYRQSKGMTCWILQANTSFNVRSYKDLVDRSEGHHWGRWDDIVYDGNTKSGFRSLYSIPLKIGEEDIGVLKVENKNVPPFYFTDSDERLFDMIGRLIAIGVKYDNEQYLGLMLRAAEIGFLASGIAHEFNNFLQDFVSLAALIRQKSREPEIQQYVENLKKRIDMAALAIENFRQIRDRRKEVESFDLDLHVRQIVDVSAERFKNSNIQFDYLNPGVRVITMNPAELQTILINLLRNAYDAVTELADRRYVRLKITREKRNVIFEVADSGGGIKPDIALHMLAPYYTTKSEGMGMGLFWVSQIVERNRGVLDFQTDNEYGGTTFRVVLPGIIHSH